jgi:ribonuclease HII
MKTAYLIEDTSAVGGPGLAPCEVGIDEAGRGPMLGRVYAAAVILPSNTSLFDHSLMKDSKKFHSEKKIREAATYIKENALAWAVAYADETVIDDINIRNATHKAMHAAISALLGKESQSVAGFKAIKKDEINTIDPVLLLLVDGNDFTPYINETTKQRVSHVCIEGGDNTYTSIAAASILAKVSRDDYIKDLCTAHPDLISKYDLLKNKGYGTKKHMDGIRLNGITPFHRKTFGLCREFA